MPPAAFTQRATGTAEKSRNSWAEGDRTIGKALLWLLAALLGVAALLVDTNREYSRNSPFYRMLLYTSIAINGLLFHYNPTSAVVTVDGKTHTHHHMCLAPTIVMYGKGKLKTLTVFPSIFKGAHIRHNEMVEVLTGHPRGI